jgi:hypothetical protein
VEKMTHPERGRDRRATESLLGEAFRVRSPVLSQFLLGFPVVLYTEELARLIAPVQPVEVYAAVTRLYPRYLDFFLALFVEVVNADRELFYVVGIRLSGDGEMVDVSAVLAEPVSVEPFHPRRAR